MAKVTLNQLIDYGACEDYTDKFEELFNEEVEVTEELVRKHYKDFDFGWAGERLLNDRDAQVYATLCVGHARWYKGQTKLHDKERYERLQEWRENAHGVVAPWDMDEYNKIWIEWQKKVNPIEDELYAKRAVDFAVLYNDERNKDMWP